MNPLDRKRALHALCASAYQAQRLDRHAEAAAAFERALQLLDPAHDTSDDPVMLRGELAAGAAAARWELGRTDGLEPSLRLALDAVRKAQDHSPSARASIVASWLQFEIARLVARRRALVEALPLFEQAIRELGECAAPMLRARIEGRLGTALAMSGDPAAAVQRLEAALAMMSHPELLGLVRERAILQMNRALALSELGQHHLARAGLELAVDQMEGLLPSQPAEAHAELARLRRNLGTVYARAGRTDDAIAQFRGAIDDFERLLARRHGPSDALQWRASMAATQMNLGYSLFVRGDVDESGLWLQRAARVQLRLVKTRPALQEDLARTWVNQAHHASRVGRLARAAALYRRAAATFEQLIEQGNTHNQSDRINAQLGLARVQLRQSKVKASASLFRTAGLALAELTRQGQLQHSQAWLTAWQSQMDEWLRLAPRRADAAAEVAKSLVAVAGQAPQRPSIIGPEPVSTLLAAIDKLIAWTAAAPRSRAAAPQYGHLVAAYLGLLFDMAAALLSDADPAWIRAHSQEVSKVVARLRDTAAAMPQASVPLVDWFLATHGLRAQRLALAQGSHPDVLALRELLHDQHALERKMLGEPAPESAGVTADTPRPDAVALLSNSTAPSLYGQRRIQAWCEQRLRIDALRRHLVDDGVLPPSMRLRANQVSAALGRRGALVLMARVNRRTMLVAHMCRAAAGLPVTGHREIVLDDDLAEFDCGDLNRAARAAMSTGSRGTALRGSVSCAARSQREAITPLLDGDLFALDMFERLWSCAVAPVLTELAAWGIDEVSIIPSDDLHLIPWTHLTSRANVQPARVEIYPSAGAWLRRCAEVDTPATAQGHTLTGVPSRSKRSGMSPSGRPGGLMDGPSHGLRHGPQWALAAGPALNGKRPLAWVVVESRLSQRLWGTDLRPVEVRPGERPRANDVTSLLGMGHGGSPDGNPAHAGLALDGVVLGASDLPRIRVCRQALLSACVLGQTEEAHGEPLGFLSACFDYRARFAAGWLTEVSDMAACLFSLSVQWVLREAYAHTAAGHTPQWTAIVQQVIRDLAAGRWPDGFHDWLAKELASAPPDDHPAPTEPPPILRRAAPWFVALGR